jgi:hypothetical protein
VEIAEKIQSGYFIYLFLVFVGTDLVTTKAVISHCCNLRTATADALKIPSSAASFFVLQRPPPTLLAHLAAISSFLPF